MDTVVRKAELADLPGIVELWSGLMDYHRAFDRSYQMVEDATERWVSYITPKLEDESHRILVAEQGGALLGYVVAVIQDYPPVFQSPRHGFVQEISVAEPYRRKGIGRKLVQAAEDWLRSRGMPEITVRIDERNPASKALFAAEGFEPYVVVRRKKLKV